MEYEYDGYTYMAPWIGDIVRQFYLVKTNPRATHPLLASGRRVRVRNPVLVDLGIGLARRHPLWVVELVAMVVSWDDVEEHAVLGVWIEPGQSDFEGGKHAPEINIV